MKDEESHCDTHQYEYYIYVIGPMESAGRETHTQVYQERAAKDVLRYGREMDEYHNKNKNSNNHTKKQQQQEEEEEDDREEVGLVVGKESNISPTEGSTTIVHAIAVGTGATNDDRDVVAISLPSTTTTNTLFRCSSRSHNFRVRVR